MEILSNGELVGSWPITSFEDAYREVAGKNIMESFAIIHSDGSDDPDKTSVLFVRLFIENGMRAKKDQKYIVGLRFYNFGDMATIDIISMDRSNHRDIVMEHGYRMDWVPLNNMSDDAFQMTYSMPLITVGAHLRVDSVGNIIPSHSSGDFGKKLLGTDVNALVRQLAFFCSLYKEQDVHGEILIKSILRVMLHNKGKIDFYELLVERYIAGTFTGQNYGSILSMKVVDRLITEERDDLLKIFIEEVNCGFARKCMLIGIANRMKA